MCSTFVVSLVVVVVVFLRAEGKEGRIIISSSNSKHLFHLAELLFSSLKKI